jgi:transcriptional regulator with XRE-family HTH domain
MQEKIRPKDAPDINARIAARVRGLRSSLGMSLEDLSERCGVSRSMISLVERGESSPTAVVLEKLAAGLGVPLAALFDDPALPASPLSGRDDRVTWRDPESGYLRRNISPASFPSAIHIVEVVLPPGARVAYESASLHDRDQQIWVQEGRIDVTVGETTHHLAEDDCLAMRLDRPIAYANHTRRPARYVVVIASRGGQKVPAGALY